MTHLISVIVPVYNEENTIGNVLDRLLRLHSGIEQEILVVNDGSTDKTEEISKLYKSFTLISHEKNMGKGVALATGMKHSRGDIITIQDADLEYFPEDIPRIVKPIIEDDADVVYGSRFLGKYTGMSMSHRIGNITLSLVASIIFRKKITDIMTGHKAFRRDSTGSLKLNEKGFAIEVEITAKIMRNKCRFIEVPINYKHRQKGYSKLKYKDGLLSLYTMLHLRFSRIS